MKNDRIKMKKRKKKKEATNKYRKEKNNEKKGEMHVCVYGGGEVQNKIERKTENECIIRMQ